MITLGLLGGVASGKSFVARSFQDLGACLLDGDEAGHEALRMTAVVDQLQHRWGPQILTSDGQVDRAAIALRVFADTPQAHEELVFLESVTHPRIAQLLEARINELAASGLHRGAILDAAVMLKAGWDGLCDRLLFVDAPVELRRERARQRGWTETQFEAREANQVSLAEKRNRADFVIDNTGTPQKTREQVEQVWHSLPEIA